MGRGKKGGTYDAIRDHRYTISVERIHQCRPELKFMLHCVREKIGIDQDTVWRAKGFIVGEEHGGGLLWNGTYGFIFAVEGLLLLRFL